MKASRWLIVAVLMLAAAAIAAEVVCPECGAPLTVTVSKVEAEPEPEPVISVLPQGVGVWKVDSRPEFLAWLREHYDWNQNWSGAYSDKGLPYIYEVKSTRLQDIQQLDNWLSGHVQNENFRGINLNCESGWSDEAQEMFDHVRETYPAVKIFTGPIGWAGHLASRERFAQFDGLVHFYNVAYDNRMPEDLYYFFALAGYYGKPVVMGVQPQIQEGTLADATLFAEGLKISGLSESAVVWASVRLFDAPESEQRTAIIAAIDGWERQPVRVVKRIPLSADPQANWRYDMSLARIVGMAGYMPCFVEAGDEADITWADIQKPEEYGKVQSYWYDKGRPGRPDNMREIVREMEEQMAQALREEAGL